MKVKCIYQKENTRKYSIITGSHVWESTPCRVLVGVSPHPQTGQRGNPQAGPETGPWTGPVTGMGGGLTLTRNDLMLRRELGREARYPDLIEKDKQTENFTSHRTSYVGSKYG